MSMCWQSAIRISVADDRVSSLLLKMRRPTALSALVDVQAYHTETEIAGNSLLRHWFL